MNRTTRLFATIWLIAAGTAGSPTPCVADTPVSLKPDTEITRLAVRLSDLFAGVPREIDRDIAQAPAPCKPALYDETVLSKLAQAYRLDWQPKSESNHITLSSACARVSIDMIREAVAERLKKEVHADKAQLEIVLDPRTGDMAVPAAKTPDIELANFSYDSAAKVFRADVTAATARGAFVLPVKGSVIIKRNVPVLARRLDSGTTIGESDLDWQWAPEERLNAEILTDPRQLIGREVRRDTPEGVLLRARDVMPQRLVQRGSLVTLKIETPYIQITSQGKAMQDGAEGDVIRVTNTQSNRTVEGVVTAPGVVEVKTARKIAAAE